MKHDDNGVLNEHSKEKGKRKWVFQKIRTQLTIYLSFSFFFYLYPRLCYKKWGGAKTHQWFALKPPNPFLWKIIHQKIGNCLSENGITVITYLKYQNEYQTALLLHTQGDEALKMYYGLQFITRENEITPDETILGFDEYAIGETNETYKHYVFHTRKQREEETAEVFITALRTLSKTCNFCDGCEASIL